jgi:hypothetical protein
MVVTNPASLKILKPWMERKIKPVHFLQMSLIGKDGIINCACLGGLITGGWLRDNGLVVEGVVALVERLGVEGAVHPVVEKLSHASVEQERPQEPFPVPQGHVAKTWKPCMSQRHQQKLQHHVVVSAKTTAQPPTSWSMLQIT